jgi:D-3-phosphoglycerate dehydrogenase
VFPRPDRGRLERLHEHGCPAVVRYGVGLDKVDVPHNRHEEGPPAGDLGIAVDNVPEYGHVEISNHASAPLAGRARSAVGFDRSMRGRPVY